MKKKIKKIVDDSLTNYDSNWKELIYEFFPEFIELVYYELFKIIDFEKGFSFLDKEFEKLIPTNEKKGKVINDKLVRAYLKNGLEKYIYIHIEVQSSYDKDFTQRMFRYFYRIIDRYGFNVTALAIYADNNQTFAPNTYIYQNLETEFIYKFKIYKVLHQKEAELLESNNPFALAVLAAYYKLKTNKTEYDSIKQYRFTFIRLLLERRYNKDKIKKLISFINNILSLPPEKELEFNDEYDRKYKINEAMPLTLNNISYDAFVQVFGEKIEQRGIQIGIQTGTKTGEIVGSLRKSFQSTINGAKMNFPFETIVDFVGIDTETCSLFLNKYKELGENVYEWFENEYIKEFQLIIIPD